jgi:hypothetical protein
LNQVLLTELRLGELLAEGGEGRVFEVAAAANSSAPALPAMVYKQLRHPLPLSALSPLCDLPDMVAARDEGVCRRALSSSAWPAAAVVEERDAGVALGALMPRAPAQFWLRHRDGPSRLATLSYLAGDPDRMAVAYGVTVPPPGAPERVALVYALARLLDAWQGGVGPLVVHGDLSAKNVLWSLQPAPAVYVLDCDGAVIGEGHGTVEGTETGDLCPRRPLRATTPNWDDPALPPGRRPNAASDRYVLGLAFLRLVGAAHFPLQGRQRAHPQVNVDLELPRSWRKFADMPGLWELCERSLSLVNAAERPTPAEWAAALEDLLDVLDAAGTASRARAAQGDERPARSWPCGPEGDLPRPLAWAAGTVPDVVVRPVLRHRAVATWQLIRPGPAFSGAGREGGSGLSGAAGPSAASGLTPRQMARRTLAAWAAAHRLAVRLVRSPGRRVNGLRRLAGVLVLDVAAACVVLFLVGMVVSPWIGL